MREALRGRNRAQPPAPVYVLKLAMNGFGFQELLFQGLERRGDRVICNRHAAMMPKSLAISAALAAVMILPSIAQARRESIPAEDRLIAACIHRSARGKPWLEEVLRALHDQERGRISAQVRNRNGSHDLGPMQINSWWVPHFAKLLVQSPLSVQQWLRQDACFNIEAARHILLNEFIRSGDIWTAVRRYHSPTWWRQRRYVVHISANLIQRRKCNAMSSRLPNPDAIPDSERRVMFKSQCDR